MLTLIHLLFSRLKFPIPAASEQSGPCSSESGDDKDRHGRALPTSMIKALDYTWVPIPLKRLNLMAR